MWAKPTKRDLESMPKLYSTESPTTADRIIHGHFFLGGCDWYVTEYCPKDRIFFGFVILNGDFQMAEWGNISYDKLIDLKIQGIFEVDYDKHWKKRPAREVDNIVKGGGVY